jgi:hypothetical protein
VLPATPRPGLSDARIAYLDEVFWNNLPRGTESSTTAATYFGAVQLIAPCGTSTWHGWAATRTPTIRAWWHCHDEYAIEEAKG